MKEFLEMKLKLVKESKQDDFEDAYVFFDLLHKCSMKRLSYQVVLNHFKKMILADVKIFRVYYPYRFNAEFFFDCLRFYRRKYDSEYDIYNIFYITVELPQFCKKNNLLRSRYGHLLESREEEEIVSKNKVEERRRRNRNKQTAKANDKRKKARIKNQKLKRHLSIMAYLRKSPFNDCMEEII